MAVSVCISRPLCERREYRCFPPLMASLPLYRGVVRQVLGRYRLAFNEEGCRWAFNNEGGGIMNLPNGHSVWNSHKVYVCYIYNGSYVRDHQNVGSNGSHGRNCISQESIDMSQKLRVSTSNVQMGVVP